MRTRSVLRDIVFQRWASDGDYSSGVGEGVAIGAGGLAFDSAIAQVDHNGVHFEQAVWTSAPLRPGFGVQEIVPSWTARTPGGSWVQIDVKGPTTQWYALGRWASHETVVRRSTIPKQHDENGR